MLLYIAASRTLLVYVTAFWPRCHSHTLAFYSSSKKQTDGYYQKHHFTVDKKLFMVCEDISVHWHILPHKYDLHMDPAVQYDALCRWVTQVNCSNQMRGM